MARTRRPWSDLRAECRRYLGDEDGITYSDELMLDGVNRSIDELSLDLGLDHEFITTRRFLRNLVAAQAYYDLPPEAIAMVKPFRIFTTADPVRERALMIDDQAVGEELSGPVTGDYCPRYRLLGNYIKLMPPPSQAEVDGLALECDVAEDRFTGDASIIPATWPVLVEPILVADTCLFCYEQEQEEGGVIDEEGAKTILRLATWRRRYAGKLHAYLDDRIASKGRIQPNRMGA